jgi:hypothetical protein
LGMRSEKVVNDSMAKIVLLIVLLSSITFNNTHTQYSAVINQQSNLLIINAKNHCLVAPRAERAPGTTAVRSTAE